MLLHAMWRSVALIFLGIFLRSLERAQTYWTFEDTLTQIGLGYTFLFLLAFTSLRVQGGVHRDPGRLLGGVRALPLPPAGFDYTQVGVRADWPHLYSGFLAHFSKNSNLSWAFDVWFLNLFPRRAVSLQRRRLVHTELHPDARDDDARPVGRALADDVARPRPRS